MPSRFMTVGSSSSSSGSLNERWSAAMGDGNGVLAEKKELGVHVKHEMPGGAER